MGYFKTKVERVETEFTEEDMEKWENKRKIELRKGLKRLSKAQDFPGGTFIGVKNVLANGRTPNMLALINREKFLSVKKLKILMETREEAPPPSSLKGPFTYETHSCKETVELLASIRDTSPRGTIINWVNKEKKTDTAIQDALYTPNPDSAWRYERKWFNGDIAEVVMLSKWK